MAYELAFTPGAVDDLSKLIKHNPALAIQIINV
jgi:hypothetical protein